MQQKTVKRVLSDHPGCELCVYYKAKEKESCIRPSGEPSCIEPAKGKRAVRFYHYEVTEETNNES